MRTNRWWRRRVRPCRGARTIDKPRATAPRSERASQERTSQQHHARAGPRPGPAPSALHPRLSQFCPSFSPEDDGNGEKCMPPSYRGRYRRGSGLRLPASVWIYPPELIPPSLDARRQPGGPAPPDQISRCVRGWPYVIKSGRYIILCRGAALGRERACGDIARATHGACMH